MSDRELLELAAKACGWKSKAIITMFPMEIFHGLSVDTGSKIFGCWNPLEDDGEALRLAVTLRLQVVMYSDWVEVLRDGIRMTNATSEHFAGCMFATARSAIVRAAAETHRREVEEKH